jgi:hypothetical protein
MEVQASELSIIQAKWYTRSTTLHLFLFTSARYDVADFQKDSIHFTSAVVVASLLSDTNTHASRWTVLLNLKRVVEAKGKDLLCSMR